MTRTRRPFRFQHEWTLDAPAEHVYAALADVERYPDWWSQVRGGHRIDESSGQIRCRSVLPFDVVMVATRIVEDPEAMVLRAGLSGDLNGWSQWSVFRSGSGSRVVYDQKVVATMLAARITGPLGRPIMRVNHELMMRSGERGLRKLLAGQVALA
jgi:uncharacterized protein YndB with AHSA1/START domain